MAVNIWAFWLVLTWLRFSIHAVFLKIVMSKCNSQVPDNKLRTNLAYSNCTCTGEYGPSIFVWTLLHSAFSVMAGAVIPQHNPWAWLLRSYYYYMACSCGWYNLHCDWLIVRHYSSVIPAGRLRGCKNKAKAIYNKLLVNLKHSVFTGPK